MIGSYIVGGTGTTIIAIQSVTGSTIGGSANLTAGEMWRESEMLPPRIEREWLRGDAGRPWSASDVAGRLPVVVELRAARRAPTQPSPRATLRRPTWAAALRAFHRDPRGLSREAR